MKKIFTLLSAFAISITTVCAQATPNAGFETWTSHTGYNTPDNWDNANPTTAILGTFTCVKATAAADVHSGAAALKLVTQTYLGNLAPGIATTGTINTTNQTVGGGIAFTGTPDSITGYYKYTSVSSDHGFASFTLFGTSNTDTVAQAYFATPAATVGSYTRFSQPLVYRNAHAVTNSIWILLSSQNQTSAKVGSTLYIDDLGLVTNPNGIPVLQNSEISVGPNPATNVVMINNVSNAKTTFTLFDLTGQKVMEEVLNSASNSVDVSSLPAGLYIYSLLDANKGIVKTAKLIVQK